ncbi:DUF4265 domain-containing protein [Saccharothrix australiensis]|uniref:Uncharacterized protein DUF4265 n=1 Tax=Saccharothrix australiensis TaxID=2072 RepID=A0A495VXV1_9PSEU|nr:DUF4265 domain-containing protein [Saccharothrix australiensis]RKT53660.1 uncharacterized protein DUF4265 [Saccharothrix australiensis]
MSSGSTSNPGDAGSVAEGEPERLYKIAFDLPDATVAWARASVERLWAGKTLVKLEVQIRNTPFYVKGIAFGDVVRVRADHERREFVFEEFVSESGHSTVRIILKEDDAEEMADALLRSFGCSWETDASGYLWAIDVPPQVDYGSMRDALLRVAGEGKIGIEEGALATAHRRGLG